MGIYPAYALVDGADGHNAHGGNEDADILVPEFSFDLDTAPMLLIHGDADGYASMGSVKVWEKLRAMGLSAELHTLALREHCFQRTASLYDNFCKEYRKSLGIDYTVPFKDMI